MLYHNVRAANARNLLQDGRLPQQLSRLSPAFQMAFRWDFCGTRLNVILGLGSAACMQVKELASDTYLTHTKKGLLSAHTGCSPASMYWIITALSHIELMSNLSADSMLPFTCQWVQLPVRILNSIISLGLSRIADIRYSQAMIIWAFILMVMIIVFAPETYRMWLLVAWLEYKY